MTPATLKSVWLVEWDIPVDRSRFSFYRKLKRLLNQRGLHGSMSTMSVLTTHDEELAKGVFSLASRFTSRVHLYRAVEVA